MASYKGTALRYDLKELAIESPMDSVPFVADQILPPIQVRETAGTIPVLSTSAGMKQLNIKRQKRGSFERGSWVWGSDSYTTSEYGYEEPIDNVEALENSDIFDEEVISTKIAINQIKLAREKRVADAVMNTTTFTAAADKVDITHEWDDATNCTPWANIEAAYQKLFAKIGFAKTQCDLILPDYAVKYVMRSDEINDNSKYTINLERMGQDAMVEYLVAYFGINSIKVVSSFDDSNGLGVEDASFAKLWNEDTGMLCKISDGSNSWKMPGLGRQPVYSKFATDFRVESYDEEQTDSRIVRAREYRGEYINSTFGVMLNNLKS